MSSKNSFRYFSASLRSPSFRPVLRQRGGKREQLGLLLAERRERLVHLRLGLARPPVEAFLHRGEVQLLHGRRVVRVHQARVVEVVRHREPGALRVVEHDDVVQREDRVVGVADHVLEHRHEHELPLIDVLEHLPRNRELPGLGARGHVVDVFEHDAELGVGLLAAGRLGVGHLRQPRAQRARRQRVVQPVGEVVLERVLLVDAVVLAVRAELDLPVPLEDRALRLVLGQFEAERGEPAHLGFAAHVPPRAELDGKRRPGDAILHNRQRSRVELLAVDLPVALHGLPVRGEDELDGLLTLEERQRLGLEPVLLERCGIRGPGLRRLGLLLIGGGRGRLPGRGGLRRRRGAREEGGHDRRGGHRRKEPGQHHVSSLPRGGPAARRPAPVTSRRWACSRSRTPA